MLDSKLIFSADQDLAQTVGDYDSTSDLDKGTGYDCWDAAIIANEIGDLWFNCIVTETFTSTDAATLKVALHDSADDITYTSTGIEVPLANNTLADLVAGKVLISVPIPQGLKRYLKVVYSIGTQTTTAGKVDTFLAGPVRVV